MELGRNKTLNRISFLVLSVFAIIGGIFLSVAIHELSHENDLKDFVDEDYTCLFVKPESFTDIFTDLDAPIGYYSYTFSDGNRTIVQEIGETTEAKAYLLTFIILGITGFLIYAQLRERMRVHILESEYMIYDDYYKTIQAIGGN